LLAENPFEGDGARGRVRDDEEGTSKNERKKRSKKEKSFGNGKGELKDDGGEGSEASV
jgi:hypothetical protein